MTFDDGIVGVYAIASGKDASGKPTKGIRLKEQFYFGYDVLGVNRYYTALQANQQIEAVLNTPGWNDVSAGKDIAVLEDGTQFTIQMVQKQMDEDGLRITKLSLERLTKSYDVLS